MKPKWRRSQLQTAGIPDVRLVPFPKIRASRARRRSSPSERLFVVEGRFSHLTPAGSKADSLGSSHLVWFDRGLLFAAFVALSDPTKLIIPKVTQADSKKRIPESEAIVCYRVETGTPTAGHPSFRASLPSLFVIPRINKA